MTISGMNILFFLMAMAIVGYTIVFVSATIAGIISRLDHVEIKPEWVRKVVDHFAKHALVHGVVLVLLLLLTAARPVKLVSQSDTQRSEVRRSFDAPEQETRPKVETSRFSYTLDKIREEEAKAREKWEQK